MPCHTDPTVAGASPRSPSPPSLLLHPPPPAPPLHQRKRQKLAAQNRQGLKEDHTSTECRLLLRRWRNGSPRITCAGDGGHRDEYGVCPCMQEEGADPDILETLMEDMEVMGRLHLVFKSDQEYPATAVQRERERACLQLDDPK